MTRTKQKLTNRTNDVYVASWRDATFTAMVRFVLFVSFVFIAFTGVMLSSASGK